MVFSILYFVVKISLRMVARRTYVNHPHQTQYQAKFNKYSFSLLHI